MGKKVNSLLNDICTSLGYTKKGDLFIRPITSDINLTIFFNLAARQIKGHVFVAPFIGLQYNNVEKLVREVSQSEWIKGYTSTINEHIGYIMETHTWKEWDFIEREADDKSLLKSLKNTLKTYFDIKDLKKSLVKYPDIYYKQFSDIEKIIEYIENSKKCGSANYELYRRLPILYYLSNRKQMGIDFINKTLTNGYCEAEMIYTDIYIENFNKLP